MLLQRADGLHQTAFEASADRHHLAGGLHLGPQHMIRGAELVEGQPRHLDHAVIQSRLKAGRGLPGDRVPDFVQTVSQRRLRRHPGDGIARGLGCQSRGPGDTRVHLDHDILEAFGMQGELNVAAPDDLQLRNDVPRRCAQHLVFLVSQRLGRRRHDGIPCMDPHRIHVFHVADGNDVSRAVPHHLVLDLFPSRYAALHQHLMHAGKPEPSLKKASAFFLIFRDPAAGTAQGVGRAQNHRIPDPRCRGEACIDRMDDLRLRHRLPDLLHGLLEQKTVLRLPDGLCLGADEPHAL